MLMLVLVLFLSVSCGGVSCGMSIDIRCHRSRCLSVRSRKTTCSTLSFAVFCPSRPWSSGSPAQEIFYHVIVVLPLHFSLFSCHCFHSTFEC